MTVMRSLRFLIGAALVAGGIQLIGPLALKLATVGVDAAAAARSAPAAPAVGTLPAAPAAPQVALPTVAIGQESADPWWEGAAAATAPDSAGGLQWDRAPPPPPAPLPAVPHELAAAAPAFGAAYRSTLRVPPPDLLDAAAPPPPTGPWTAPDPTAPDRAPPPVPGVLLPMAYAGGADITVPATYRVVDGDDLGTIAGRFYGHPSAASAIWAANRDAIPDPDVLPIGAELRLPPSWAVAPLHHGSRGAIEPVAYARPVAPAVGHSAVASVAPQWLPPGPPSPPAVGPQPGGIAPASAPGVAATSVRVGPGETLTSLARRLYGDPALAAEIFAVNHDRLRSPELVVAGMELRLPRPVTVPRT